MPDIVLANQAGNQTCVIREMSLLGLVDGKKVVTFHQGEATLQQVIAETGRLLNRLLAQQVTPWRAYNLHMLFGDLPLTEAGFSFENRVEPDSRVCLRLQDLCSFYYAGREKIDQIICQLTLASGMDEVLIEAPIDLTPYECKGQYSFPIRGSSTVNGTPWNRAMGHRLAHSQEFAFDVVDFRRDERGCFVLSLPPKSEHVDDYFLFGREVCAVGDGVVVAAGDQWPNAWVENPLAYSEDCIVALTDKLLAEGIEFNHAILGNYVVIDHRNGEFSLYAHMSQGTLTVVVGDAVSQGQTIGKVGNTSNSDYPHLHFHLMDGPNYQVANGLPVTFTDLPAGQPPLCDFRLSNSLLYSDYLFVYLPE